MTGKALAVIAPVASCGRCGECCRQIWVPLHPDDFDKVPQSETIAFMRQHWTWTGEQHPTDEQRAADAEVAAIYPRCRYTCDQFDEATSSCMAHEQRPPVCRGFPWYGGEPNGDRIRGFPPCTFWLDVPDEQRRERWTPRSANAEASL